MNEEPKIKWIKNDPEKHNVFEDMSQFLVVLRVGKEGGPYDWEFSVVNTNCGGGNMELEDTDGNAWDAWEWSDIEYFHVIHGSEPTSE